MATAKKALDPISEKIKMLMEKKGLTAYALGKMCDMPPSTIARITSGRANPRASTLATIALALGTTLEELIGEERYYQLVETEPVLKTVPNKRIPVITADTASWLNDRNIDESRTLSREDILWIPGLPDQELSNIVDYCVVAPDDAMYPEIKRGDYLYFRKVRGKGYAKSGDIVAVIARKDGPDPVLDVRKVFFMQNDVEIYLPSEAMKEQYPKIVFSPRDANPNECADYGIVGVLVAKISTFR